MFSSNLELADDAKLLYTPKYLCDVTHMVLKESEAKKKKKLDDLKCSPGSDIESQISL